MLDLRKLSSGLLIGCLVGVFSPTVLAQGASNSVNLAVAVFPKIADLRVTVVMIEYERLLGQKLSVFARGSRLNYKFDDDDNVEDGTGTGLGGGVRFYPFVGLKGFYVGGGINAFKGDWDFVSDKGQSFESRGTGETSAIQWGVEVGYRFHLGSPLVTLTPSAHAGSWVGDDSNCKYTAPASRVGTACSVDSELGFYVVASVALGIAF